MGPGSVLTNKIFISTREKGASFELQKLIQEKGGTLLEFPMIDTCLRNISDEEKNTLGNLQRFEWLVFTSANGVRFFFDYCSKYSIVLPSKIKYAAISEKTSQKLKKYGFQPDFIGTKGNGKGFAKELGDLFTGKNIKLLFITGNLAPNILEEALAEKHIFSRVDIYETKIPEIINHAVIDIVLDNKYDVIFTYSPSAVQNLFNTLKGKMNPVNLKIGCIGPTSQKACFDLGITPLFMAENPNTISLFKAMLNYFNK